MLVLVAALSLGCPETRAQRGRDALDLVVRMHREICQAETRRAWAFRNRPEWVQARLLASWPRSRVADTDGLRVERDLLISFMALRQGARDEDLPEQVRQYLLRRLDREGQELDALDRLDRSDAAPLDALVRQGDREICQEEREIVRRYLTRLDSSNR
jgi:hypothetical protein